MLPALLIMFVPERLTVASVVCGVCASWMQLGDRGQVEIDFAKAFQLFTELADVGHPAGQHVSFILLQCVIIVHTYHNTLLCTPDVLITEPQVLRNKDIHMSKARKVWLSLRRGSTVANEVHPRHGYC